MYAHMSNQWAQSLPYCYLGSSLWCAVHVRCGVVRCGAVRAGPDGTPAIPHRSRLKLKLQAPGGWWADRVPAWIRCGELNGWVDIHGGEVCCFV